MSHWVFFGLGCMSMLALAVAAVAGLRTRLIYVEHDLSKMAKRLEWNEGQMRKFYQKTDPYRSAPPEPTSKPSAGRIVER
jgi:hypothetical protein